MVAFKREVYHKVAREFLPVLQSRRRADGGFQPWKVPPLQPRSSTDLEGVQQRGSVVPFLKRRSNMNFVIERSRILPALEQPLGPGPMY